MGEYGVFSNAHSHVVMLVGSISLVSLVVSRQLSFQGRAHNRYLDAVI